KLDLTLRGHLVSDAELVKHLPRSLPGGREVRILISDALRRQERFLDRSGRGNVKLGPALWYTDSCENARNHGRAAGDDGSRGDRSREGRHDERHVKRLALGNRSSGARTVAVSHFYLAACFGLEVRHNLLGGRTHGTKRQKSNLTLGMRARPTAKHQRYDENR